MAIDASEVEVVESVETETASESEQTEKTNVQVMFVVPVELKQLIDNKAEEDGKSTSAWLRALVADEFDYELPLSIITRAKKYANDTERKAAQAAKAKNRNELLKRLLTLYRQGEIDLDDDDPEE